MLVSRDGKFYVAWCPEFDMSTKGRTAEKAAATLEDAVYAYLDAHPGRAATA